MPLGITPRIGGKRIKKFDIKTKKVKQFLEMLEVKYYVDPNDKIFLFEYHDVVYVFNLNIGFNIFIYSMIRKNYREGYERGRESVIAFTRREINDFQFKLITSFKKLYTVI